MLHTFWKFSLTIGYMLNNEMNWHSILSVLKTINEYLSIKICANDAGNDCNIQDGSGCEKSTVKSVFLIEKETTFWIISYLKEKNIILISLRGFKHFHL